MLSYAPREKNRGKVKFDSLLLGEVRVEVKFGMGESGIKYGVRNNQDVKINCTEPHEDAKQVRLNRMNN